MLGLGSVSVYLWVGQVVILFGECSWCVVLSDETWLFGVFFVAVLSRSRLKKYVAVFETKQEQ